MNKTPLRTLILEDCESDARLILHELQCAGFDPQHTRVETEADFLSELEKEPEIILSDFNLPQFDGLRALHLLKERQKDIPFIIVSGTIGEEAAVQALHEGAADYLLKDRPVRLGAAVKRALEQKRLHEEQRRNEDQLRLQATVLTAAANGIVVTNRNGTILWANAAFLKMTGYERSEVIGMTPRILKSGKHDPSFYRDMWNTIRSGRVWQGAMINRRKDGSLYHEEMSITPVIGEQGRISHFVAIKQDVTERKRMEQALKESEQRYRNLVDSAPDIIFTVSLDGTITNVNSAFETATGWAREEWVGKHFWPLVHPEESSRAEEEFARVIQEKPSQLVDFRILKKSGDYLEVEITSTALRVEGEIAGALGIARDVTEHKKLEEQFRQAQKMEALGLLAGGVAHDFNNLLTVINGFSEILMAQQPPDDPSRKMLEQIHSAGERAARLTQQLLVFSRKELVSPQVLDLNAVITESKKMLGRLIGEHIELTTKLAPSLWPIKMDLGHVDQVIVNLSVNSRDAMPRGGRITLETTNVDFSEDDVRDQRDARPGPHVLLAVTDTGCGIDAETLPRIFEPLFTTKAKGKGTGLGLATVHGIVQQAGGFIRVASEVGKGTTISIYIPRSKQSVEDWRKDDSELPPLTEASETILLVEDDDGVRRLTRKMLESCGYVVLEAADGNAAIEICDREKNIDLVLTDVVMPHLSGRELRDRVLALRPGIRMLFMSGYTEDSVMIQEVMDEGLPILHKPFSMKILRDKIREAFHHSRYG